MIVLVAYFELGRNMELPIWAASQTTTYTRSASCHPIHADARRRDQVSERQSSFTASMKQPRDKRHICAQIVWQPYLGSTVEMTLDASMAILECERWTVGQHAAARHRAVARAKTQTQCRRVLSRRRIRSGDVSYGISAIDHKDLSSDIARQIAR